MTKYFENICEEIKARDRERAEKKFRKILKQDGMAPGKLTIHKYPGGIFRCCTRAHTRREFI